MRSTGFGERRLRWAEVEAAQLRCAELGWTELGWTELGWTERVVWGRRLRLQHGMDDVVQGLAQLVQFSLREQPSGEQGRDEYGGERRRHQ
jgi:hypothetical protein